MHEQRLELHGVPVRLMRKNIKNLYIRVKPPAGEVNVSVPLHTSEQRIALFLEEHWDWIEKKREEVVRRKPVVTPEAEYVTGEVHFLWGEPYELLVERSLKRPLTELRGEQIYMRVNAKSTKVERGKQLDKWYVTKLEEKLSELVPRYETMVGRQAAEWRFRRMKTRWGTCNIQKARICLNIQLAEKPLAYLEYVVVHELTHLHEAGHNKRFWGLMDRFYPRWREIKKQMKEGE